MQHHASGLLRSVSRTTLTVCLTYALIKSSNICYKVTQLLVPEHFRSKEQLLWVKLWEIRLSSLSLARILPRQRENQSAHQSLGALAAAAWQADILSNSASESLSLRIQLLHSLCLPHTKRKIFTLVSGRSWQDKIQASK